MDSSQNLICFSLFFFLQFHCLVLSTIVNTETHRFRHKQQGLVFGLKGPGGNRKVWSFDCSASVGLEFLLQLPLLVYIHSCRASQFSSSP